MSARPNMDPDRPEIPERYVSAAQLAELMGVSVRTITNWTAEGCPRETWGMRARRYLPSAVMEWARNRTKEAA